ncbi:hypothetical protein BJX64DRAFT_267836 [Aspergillus heterothallicus]
MPILTPQDSFDTVPDDFINMATTEAINPQNTTRRQLSFGHQLASPTAEAPEHPSPSLVLAPATAPTTNLARDDFFREDEDDHPVFPREPRGRTRRVPLRRPRRDFSPASSTYSRSPTRSPPLDLISSYTELFTSPSQTATATLIPDRIALLSPFSRPAYITTHPASRADFTHWLPLLALGAPETWYTFSPSEISISTSTSTAPGHFPLLTPPPPHHHYHTYLKPLSDPRPVALRMPRITANAPLHPDSPLPPTKSSSSSSTKDGPAQPPDLIYLTIQSSISGHTTNPRGGRWISPERGMLPDLARSAGVAGTSIYRVVRSGSREEAGAQAFYAAAGNRWATVFTCVVVLNGDGDGGSGLLGVDAGGYERVGSLEELVSEKDLGVSREGEGRRRRVFY